MAAEDSVDEAADAAPDSAAQAGAQTAARFRIVGRVQGVYFRASTREQALRLGLRGHARNLRDGSVEVLAAGNTDALDTLATWLAHGPPMARVERVERAAADAASVPEGFATA